VVSAKECIRNPWDMNGVRGAASTGDIYP